MVKFAAKITEGEDIAAQTAILWTMRNCLAAEGPGSAGCDVSALCRHLCDSSQCAGEQQFWSDADGFCDPVFCRLFGILCGVVLSDIPDPTHGALRFHRHDRTPAWCRGLEPSALVGRYFFYNDVSLVCV